MLPEVIAAHVHQLHGVQRAAAQMRLRAGVGSHTVKGEVRTHNGHAALGAHLVHAFGVPRIGKIHPIEIPGPGNELLGTGALLGGTAKENHRPVLMLPDEIILQRRSGGKAPGPQQIVAAAMTGSAGLHRLLHRAGGLLAQARQRVILR